MSWSQSPVVRWRRSILLAIAAGLGLTACATTPASTSPSVASMFAITRFVAVGDSITVGNSMNFSGGSTGNLSWVTYARSRNLVFAGGWAASGATTVRMAQSIRPVKADVLVILAGTNDLAQGVPFSVTSADLDRIVETVGAPRVIVSAIPPRDSAPAATADFNASLKDFVASRGWEWVDAPSAVRVGAVTLPACLRTECIRPRPEPRPWAGLSRPP